MDAWVPPPRCRGAAAEAQGPGRGVRGAGRAEMWNPLHEADSTFVAWRRPRWLCVGALVLAAGLLIVGFLFGRGALDSRTPAPTPRARGSRDSGAAVECGPVACFARGPWFGLREVGTGPPRISWRGGHWRRDTGQAMVTRGKEWNAETLKLDFIQPVPPPRAL